MASRIKGKFACGSDSFQDYGYKIDEAVAVRGHMV
jgi:hypothetical protein